MSIGQDQDLAPPLWGFRGSARDPRDLKQIQSTALVENLLARFTYKPGWKFTVVKPAYAWDNPRLHIILQALDCNCPEHTVTVTTGAIIPWHLRDENHAMLWLLETIVRMERHEVEEFFRVDGKAPFDPHAKETNK